MATCRHPCEASPVRELEQVPGGRPEGAHLALDPAVDHAAQAGHHRVLVNVKAGAQRMKKIHGFLLCGRCRHGIPVEGTLESVLRVAGDPTATITGAQGSQAQLIHGLGAPREKSTSLPTAAPSYRETRPFHPPGSAQRPVDN